MREHTIREEQYSPCLLLVESHELVSTVSLNHSRPSKGLNPLLGHVCSTPTDDVLQNIAAQASHASLLPARLFERDPALDAVHQAGERQTLQIDLAWSGHLGKEQTFAAKQRVLESAHELDVVIHRGGKG